MDMATAVVVVVALVMVTGLVLLLARQGHPEDAGRHFSGGKSDEGPAEAGYPPGSGPAGPGAEGMAVPGRGDISPGDGAGDEDPPRERR